LNNQDYKNAAGNIFKYLASVSTRCGKFYFSASFFACGLARGG